MNQEDIIRMAREAGLIETLKAEDDLPSVWTTSTAELERFAALVKAHKTEVALVEAYEAGAAAEREVIIAMLEGIDKTELESDFGYWETSTGAAFGAGISKAIRARGQ